MASLKPYILTLSLWTGISCTRSMDEQWNEPLWEDDIGKDLALPNYDSDPIPGIKNRWDQSPELSETEKQKYWDTSPSGTDKSRIWQNITKDRMKVFSRRWVLPKFQPAYRKPSLRSEVVSHLIQGDEVWVQSIHEKWARLKSGVWVPVRKLSSFPPSGPTQPWQELIEEEDLFP